MLGTPGESVLARLDRWLDQVLYHASAVVLVVIALAVMYTVVARYFFSASPIWSEEAPRVLFLWLCYLGVAVATRRGHNLRVTFIVDRFPPRLRALTDVVMDVLVIVMLAVLFYFNWRIVVFASGTKMIATGWSNAVGFLPLSVGCAFMLLYQVMHLVRRLRRLRDSGGGKA
ncbi:MAG: TRAP transporter small permease [Alphaproteobacteria bacterium]|nr:TRAP transporter small permease [Alphaproteobacteria bacterium]